VAAKSLPESFGNLLNLEALDLSKSSLMNLPISINKLDKLKNLILRSCSFLLILPESFSELKFLTHLDLSDCHSLQSLPQSFGNLLRLCFLLLSGCSALQKLPESISDLKNLIHLDISRCSSLNGLPESFGNICKLKILDLSCCYQLRHLPESFSNLENLEHLNLSLCNELEELPECLGNLKCLKFLNLSSCNALRNLPKSFGCLLNLEKIDASYCCKLEEFPESIVNSGKLQMLDLRGCPSLVKFTTIAKNFINSQGFILLESAEIFECKEIGRGGIRYSTIVMLEHLNQIRGNLCITCIETLHSSEEAERAKFCNKSKLQTLTLQWSSSTCESSKDAKKDELVLEKLQPHPNLELLTLDGYRGTRFPSWLMGLESALPNLTQITLCNLPHCEQLPPFEHMNNLEILKIHNIPKIKRIQTDMEPSRGSFRKLKTLSINEMSDLEEWLITGSTNDAILERLEIYRCPRIIFRPCLPNTEISVITESNMSLSLENVASLSFKSRISKMFIENCSITSDEWGGLGCHIIKDLEIKACKELYLLPRAIVGLTSLECLTINDCNNLSVLPEWLGELASLRSLSICCCPNLKSLPLSIQCHTTLENLHVQDCCVEFEELCQAVNRIFHSDPSRSVFSVRGEEIYDAEDILSTSNEELGRIVLFLFMWHACPCVFIFCCQSQRSSPGHQNFISKGLNSLERIIFIYLLFFPFLLCCCSYLFFYLFFFCLWCLH
jgi:Leucine rich repeat